LSGSGARKGDFGSAFHGYSGSLRYALLPSVHEIRLGEDKGISLHLMFCLQS
jgi:hypothetical protein